jgi:hypothetical protein
MSITPSATSTRDPVVEAKARALGALRRRDLAEARKAVTDARCRGASREEIAFMLDIPTPQPDAVYQREIAKVLSGERVPR